MKSSVGPALNIPRPHFTMPPKKRQATGVIAISSKLAKREAKTKDDDVEDRASELACTVSGAKIKPADSTGRKTIKSQIF